MWCLPGTGVQSSQTWSCSLHIQRVYRKQKCVLQGEGMTAVLGLAIGNCHFGRSKNSNIKFQILKILSQDSDVAFVFDNIWMSLSRGYICPWEKLPSQAKWLVGETETAFLELQEQALDSAELPVKWKEPPLHYGVAALSVKFSTLLAHPAHLWLIAVASSLLGPLRTTGVEWITSTQPICFFMGPSCKTQPV